MHFLTKARSLLLHLIFLSKSILLKVYRLLMPDPLKKLVRKVLRLGERKIIAQNRAVLEQILQKKNPGEDYRAVIIFPPSLSWDVQLFQRPQQLALALAKKGALVFYIQPTPDRKQEPFQLISERLYLCNVHVDTFQELSSPLIYLLTWNSDYASCFRNPRILYDFVDDVDVFYGDHKKIVKGHQILLKNASLVLATAHKLTEEASLHRSDVVYSPNGVVYEHFACPAQHDRPFPPKDLQPILTNAKPVIGYYGALARWFDYELLKSIASLRPDYEFVLIGPDYDGTLEPAKVSKFPNIHWLGVKPYAELPDYLRYFDVATIPFIVNEITHAVSPLKLFEYMAGGKPIVITPMRESMQYEGVLIAEGPEAFAAQLDHALSLCMDTKYIETIKSTAQKNTWESRAEEILCRIED